MSRIVHPIAYQIQTSRLLMRGWDPQDAPALCQALATNVDHLRPWLPWAALEPESISGKLEKLRQWRAEFDRGEQFRFGIFDRNASTILGSIGFHNRIGAGALEIGYWVASDRVRQGIATEAAGALVRIGFEVRNLRRIEIHCDPLNIASAGVPRRLGFRHVCTIMNQCHDPSMKPRNSSIWVLQRHDYSSSAACTMPVTAQDALGAELLGGAP